MFPNQQRNHEENDENKIDLQQFTLNYLYSTRKLNQSLLGLNNLFYLPQIASLQHDVGNVNVLNQIQSPHNNQISIYKQHSNPHLNYQHQQHQVFNYKQNPTITFGSQLEPPLRVSERTSNQASYVQSRSIFKNRTIDDYRQLNEFQKAYDETKAALRIVPRHQDLNYLNCPFPDINHPYHPLDHFNYAVPQKIEVFEQCQPVNSHDYDRMREDFENNGKDADWTSEEIAERRGSTLLSVNILEDFHFPPLDLPSEHKSSQIWKIQYEAPILPVNSNVDTSLVIVPSDNEAVLKKKQLKPNRKSLENVSFLNPGTRNI